MYLFSAPNRGTLGNTKKCVDPALATRWVEAEDRPGYAVYHCPNPLKPGATTHGKGSIAAIEWIFVDIDFKSIVETPDQVAENLRCILLEPTELVHSGGGYHIKYKLKEPVAYDDPEYDSVCELQAALIGYFAADPQVRPWSLLRLPGTTNSKYDPPTRCEVVRRGPEVDQSELKEMIEIVADSTLFTRKPAAQGSNSNGHAEEAPRSHTHGPVDVEAELAAMVYEAADGRGINETYTRVVLPLLRRAMHPNEVVDVIAKANVEAGARAGENWTLASEVAIIRRRLNTSIHNVLLKEYFKDGGDKAGVIPDWLPGEWHQHWTEILQEGKRPDIIYNGSGKFFVRGLQRKTRGATGQEQSQDAGGKAETGTRSQESASDSAPRKIRFKLVSFADLRPGPEPLYLVDELIPIAGLVDVWGKAKCYKSFWCLDLMLHVAMGWEYRDRYVRQGTVVYCAFEGAHGYKKRVEALRRHYTIEEGTAVPLHVMPGQANLIKDHRLLIADIKYQLGETMPVAVVLDTLNKSLHGSENKDIDMGDYIRAAEVIRDTFGCVVIIVHHCGYDDTRPRGHSSLPGAVDAQLSVVRAEATVTVTVEMMRDGPEDIAVTSTAQAIEVGHDQNGKTLTSLVMIPGEPQAYATERKKWPKGLAAFFLALKSALASKGVAFQPEVGVLPVRAVDLEAVRAVFYCDYAVAEGNKEKDQDALRQAFKRGLGDAQKKEIVRSLRTSASRTMIWLPVREQE